jgi:hypothetical protein
MTYFEPWLHKKGSNERGVSWDNLATRLGKCDKLKFWVTQKTSETDIFCWREGTKRKLLKKKELWAIPLIYRIGSVNGGYRYLVTMFEEADQAEVEKKKDVEKEAAEIQEVRRGSLESFNESRK